MISVKVRDGIITVFVIAWLILFYYESMRYNYLSPLAGRELPKFKFLFPPAGWIMFFQVDESEGRAEVYGIRESIHGRKVELIDPHRIFENHWIGYDNIRRNVLISVLHPSRADSFCHYLKRKFPQYERFAVTEAIYPSSIKYPEKKILQLAYAC